MIDAIAGVLGTVLASLFDVAGSLGVSIVLLTLIINLALFPLMLKQTRASRAFAALQPEIKALQDKHKDDPKKLQEEMVVLQRESGATPLGCLGPMLFQLPIWYGLFRMLREGTEFVPSDSALWVAIDAGNTIFLGMDLTKTASEFWPAGFVAVLPYVLAILFMVAVQYFQQVHSQSGVPQDSNPQAQMMQKVTKALPVFFGVIAIQFTAGVIVYWGTSNLFRLGQQALIFKIDGRPQSAAAAVTDSDNGPEPDDESPAAPPKKPQGSAKKRKRRRY